MARSVHKERVSLRGGQAREIHIELGAGQCGPVPAQCDGALRGRGRIPRGDVDDRVGSREGRLLQGDLDAVEGRASRIPGAAGEGECLGEGQIGVTRPEHKEETGTDRHRAGAEDLRLRVEEDGTRDGRDNEDGQEGVD